jgi:KDO2-lipid IV(A) lauroyltransferase
VSHLGVLFMRALAHLPLAWVRAIGWLLGWVLYFIVIPRRHVVQSNLELCFPTWTAAQRRALGPRIFIHVAQAWLDRSWLWHGDPAAARGRLQIVGAVDELAGSQPTVIFAPHFVGLDAGWTALTQQLSRAFTTIYTNQANEVVDAWILAGRRRFGSGRLFGRVDGV